MDGMYEVFRKEKVLVLIGPTSSSEAEKVQYVAWAVQKSTDFLYIFQTKTINPSWCQRKIVKVLIMLTAGIAHLIKSAIIE